MLVYCEVRPYTTPLAELRPEAHRLLFTGGPQQRLDEHAPHCGPRCLRNGVPAGYLLRLPAWTHLGDRSPPPGGHRPGVGKTETYYDTYCRLFRACLRRGVLDEHGDYMDRVPRALRSLPTQSLPQCAIADEARAFYGVQYHPEDNHTPRGG